MAHPTILELFNLTGLVALITGGARNLGCDMATALAKAVCDVAVTSPHQEWARDAAHHIAADTGRRALGFACDVRREEQVTTMV
jgi:NAD(P)-dependent dehydrogenase (short-subunit alcohol dehydrogenase family)